MVVGEADQAGFSLDRDYYLVDDRDRVALREAYRAYIVDAFALLGEPRAQAESDGAAVLAIETSLARASLDRVAHFDPKHRDHRLDRAGLVALAPAFDWDTYFAALGVPSVTAINVVAPESFKQLGAIVQDLPRLKPYLKWFTVAPYAWLTSGPLFARRHQFRKDAVGATGEPPHWRTCIDAATQVMPDTIGRAYVARAFGPEAKARALDMVERIEAAFDANLATLGWMDAPTRVAASAKLHTVANAIGYPDHWRDYGPIAIDRHALLPNYLAAVAATSRYELAKIGKPVDRGEMARPVQTVDANYSPYLNEMTFPAGIMQPPFFGANAPDAANFGGIGFVVGHELTHGFDNQGRQFDGAGNLRDWWSAASGSAYAAKTACVADQYSGYVATGDIHLDGKATLAENIADNGGLKLALAALHTARGGRPERALDGFSEDQQFFIAFAQTWCTEMQPETEAYLARSDEHSARRWRVDGSVANLPAFAEAFQCKAGAPLAPAARCEVW